MHSSTSPIWRLNPAAAEFTSRQLDSNLNPAPVAGKWYELRRSPGRGVGIFATQRIPRGTRIMCERALFKVAGSLVHLAWEPYCHLSAAERAAYDSFHFFPRKGLDLHFASRMLLMRSQGQSLRSREEENLMEKQVRVMGQFSANNFHLFDGQVGVFAAASRLNHSCVPNVYAYSNPILNMETVHATRDIEQDEEIVTNYLDAWGAYQTKAQRQVPLMADFGFHCRCDSCGARTALSDHRRERMWILGRRLHQCRKMGRTDADQVILLSPAEATNQAEELIGLLLEERLCGPELVRAYRDASFFALLAGNLEKALEYAEDEAAVQGNIVGYEPVNLTWPQMTNAEWVRCICETTERALQ